MILYDSAPELIWQVYLPGELAYLDCWHWQQQLVSDRKQDPTLEDVLILVEHPPVYTLGKGSDLKYIKFDPTQSDFDLVQVERGGEVTYHALGQLVAYPILNLQRYQTDLHWYLRQLEAVVIEVLSGLGLDAERIPGLTGVWLRDRKIAAVGIKVSRWITMHGLALNVCIDLEGFRHIVPCGIADKPVGSLAEFIPHIQVAEVYPLVISAFEKVFKVQLKIQGFDRVPRQVDLPN